MPIGAHVSIAGGIDTSIERGATIGAEVIQTFASPPRTLSFTPFTEEALERYRQRKAASAISCHVFHAVYLVNLANERPEYVKASIASLINYQSAAQSIGALGTIFHVGSHKGAGFDQVKQGVAEAIAEIVAESPENVVLMLENAAGHNGTIGQTFAELLELFYICDHLGVPHDRIGLCLDTQHAFASGIDGRDQTSLNEFIDVVVSELGQDAIKVVHLNDSKVPFNSHKDRHENIGAGELGQTGLRHWLTHPLLADLPFILEVPGVDGKGPGKADLQLAKELWQ